MQKHPVEVHWRHREQRHIFYIQRRWFRRWLTVIGLLAGFFVLGHALQSYNALVMLVAAVIFGLLTVLHANPRWP